jgi:hypothetical protein
VTQTGRNNKVNIPTQITNTNISPLNFRLMARKNISTKKQIEMKDIINEIIGI